MTASGSSRNLPRSRPELFPNELAAIDIDYNMPMPIPAAIHGQKYISLATFRKTGVAVPTPIWFAEDGDKLVFMTNSKLGKVKRIRNNAQVKIAPCTIRGKITGSEFAATARILSIEDAARVRQAIKAKYWLARVPFLWRNTDTYVEITPAA
jgi:PPOX class probable F420-dependent enzyme